MTNVGDIVLREGRRVLLLVDIDTPGTTALVDALTAAGNEVTRRPAPEYTWNATNPPLTDFDVVVHLNGDLLGSTSADGSFLIPDVPTIQSNIQVTAVTTIGSARLAGSSSSILVVPNGITDAGKITVSCSAPLCER